MRERDIFIEALERGNPCERAALLDEACQEDVELRERVEQLLADHERQESFILDTPPIGFNGFPSGHGVGATVDSPITERPGTIIGSYKLLQQIGEGGMGVVFMAEQSQPIQRTVALKVIKPGMDTRQIIARFEAERQAVAMMDHPNIAKVLDAGTTESCLPYFVMELVKGVPITKYCDEKHLPLPARLELFVQVCQAVQHAHQKGIIHRDIKPNNVLVGEYDHRAIPKVIDFGVAKATAQRLTERTLFTEFGQVLGTMEYMSPEQSKFNQLDIDTRSDIYSLGVLLYELLAGSTPFEGKRLHAAAFDEMLRIIREEEPPKPSTRISSIDTLPSVAVNRHTEPARLSKDVQGELDWIVMKALEKDRNRRYETASGLAADIERHLQDEPVEAGPPSAPYRFRKFAKRNKAVLATTAIVAASLVLGTVVSLWQARRALEAERLATRRLEAEEVAHQEADQQRRAARDAQLLAQKNADEAEAQRNRAEANLLKAREMVDQLLTQVGESSHDTGAQMEPVRGELLAEALKLYQGFLDQHSTDPAVRLATARTWERIGGIHEELGQYPQSQKAYHESIAVLEKLVEEFPSEPTYRDALAHSYGSLGFLCSWALGEQETAEDLFSKALTVEEALAKEFPNRPDYQALLATMASGRGLSQASRGRRDEAEKSLRQALDISVKLARDNPSQSSQPGLHYYYLGRMLYWSQKTGEAETAFRDALAILERFGQDPTQLNRGARFVLSDINLHLGMILSQSGRTEEAEERLRSALAVRQKMAADFPDQPRLQAQLAAVEIPLADLLAKAHRDAEAEQLLRHARDTMEAAAAKDTVLYPLWESQEHLANFLKDAERTEEAEQVHRQAIALYEKLAADNADVPEHRRNVAWRHYALGEFRRDTDQQIEAVEAFRQALGVSEKLVAEFPQIGQYHEQWTFARLQLISLLKATGQVDEIENVHRMTIALYDRLGNSLTWLHEGRLKALDVEYRSSLNVEDVDERREVEKYYQATVTQIAEWGVREVERPMESEPANWALWAARGRMRARLGLWDEAAADFAKAAELQGDKAPDWLQADWWVVGPYPESLTEPFPPETDPDPFHPVAAAKNAEKGAARELPWLTAYPVPIGRLDFATYFNNAQHATAYAFTRVYSRKEQEVALALGSDDQLRLWVNGSLVHEYRGPGGRGVTGPDQMFVPVTLRAGWNTLLAKVVNTYPAGHALYLHISDDKVNLGRAYAESGQWDKADPLLAAIIERPLSEDEAAQCNEWCNWFPCLAVRQLGLQHVENAEKAYGYANAFAEKLKAEFPDALKYGHEVAGTHSNVAQYLITSPDPQLHNIDVALKVATKAVEISPDDGYATYGLALLRLQLEDRDGYRKVCSEMIERFGSSANTYATEWTVWTCVLSPDAVTDWLPVVQIAEKSLAGDPKNFDRLQYLGAALYRAGRFEDAAKRLIEAKVAFPETKNPRSSIIYNRLFQAMTEHQLNHAEEAENSLKKAIEDIEQPPHDGSPDAAALAWNRRMTLQLLRHEAEQLLKKEAKIKDQ